MTTFKVPDFASKGGNFLSKFIYLYDFALPLKIARHVSKLFAAIICDCLMHCSRAAAKIKVTQKTLKI